MTRWRLLSALVALLFLGSPAVPFATTPAAAFTTAWPQLGNNPQHQNNTTDNLVPQNAASNGTGGDFAIVWGKAFYPEHVYPAVQPIINGGDVFIGTLEGRLWALNASTGACAWVYPTSCGTPRSSAIGAIASSVAATSTNVYAATEAGVVYAITISTGALNWQTNLLAVGNLDIRTGVSSAVVMDDNVTPSHIYVVQRSGVVSSLDPATGAISWQFAIGTPTLQTPAYDGGSLYVTSTDGEVRAIDTSTHTLTWTSAQLNGLGTIRQWMVTYNGNLFARTWGDSSIEGHCGSCPSFNATGGLMTGSDTGADYSVTAQNTTRTNYQASPSSRSLSLTVLTESTGAISTANQLDHWNAAANDGNEPPPPCIDTVGNNAIVPLQIPNANPNVAAASSFTATTGSTTTVINDTSVSWAVNQWKWGPATLKFTSGANNGASQTVSSNTATSVTVSSAFANAPASGDTFTLTPNGSGTTGWGIVTLGATNYGTATPMNDALGQVFQFNSFYGGYGNRDGRVYCTVVGNGILTSKQEPTDTFQGFYPTTAIFAGATNNTWTFVGDCVLQSSAFGCTGYSPTGNWQEGAFPSGGGAPSAITNNMIYQQSDEQLVVRKAACATPAAGCT